MEKETFQYTYCAEDRSEVERIRDKYLPKQAQEDKLEQLRRLDRSASQKAQIWSLVLGILGALILGTGMSLFMTDLGNALGSYAMLIGILLGAVGLILAALAYPVYNSILKKERRRIAPEILRLSDELMNY